MRCEAGSRQDDLGTARLSATIALGWWLVLLVVRRRGNLDSGACVPDLKAVRLASACTAACAVTWSTARESLLRA